MTSEPPAPADPAPSEDDAGAQASQRETRLAAKNGAKLMLSMGATLTVAFVIRFWLPRSLGPATFGQFHFAEAFCEALYLFTALGVADYIGKEVSTRTEHASEFFGGMVLVRAVLSVLLCGLMFPILWLIGKGRLEMTLCFILAGWQVALIANQTFSALLNAKGEVDELALVRVASKIVWGLGIGSCLLFYRDVRWVAVWFLVGEAIQTPVLFAVARRRLRLRFRVDLGVTKMVLLGSVPYFVNFVATRIYDRIDVQMLSVMTDDKEVGYYGAAANLALGGILFLPVLNAVVLPMGARIGQASRDELNRVMRAAVRGALVIGSLVTVMLWLHAESGTTLIFGDRYENAVPSLRMLSFLFPLTYMAVLGSMHLVQVDKVWSVTKISLFGLVLNPVLNVFFIPWFAALYGEGGGGLAAATTSVLSELVAAALMLYALGRAGVDKHLFVTIGSCATLGALLLGLHVFVLFPLDLWAVPVEVLAFLLGAFFLGQLPFLGPLGRKVMARLGRS